MRKNAAIKKKRPIAPIDRWQARGREVWRWHVQSGEWRWQYNCARICEAEADVAAGNSRKGAKPTVRTPVEHI